MEVVAAVNAVAQLMSGAGHASQLATDIYKSFRDAPKELSQLATKFALVKCRMQQIQKFGDELSNSDMEDLFPEDHRTLLVAVLEPSMALLEDLRCLKPATKPDSFKARYSWATLDRRRVNRIMKDLADANVLLSQCLEVFSARLEILNHTNMGALRAGQHAVQATGLMLQASVMDVQRTQEHAVRKVQESMDASQMTHHLLQESLAEQRKFMAEQRAAMELMSGFISAQKALSANAEQMKGHTNLSLTDQVTLANTRLPDKQLDIPEPRRDQQTFSPGPRTLKRITGLPEIQRTSSSTMIEWKFGQFPVISTPVASCNKSRTLSFINAKVTLRKKTRGKRIDTYLKSQIHIFGTFVLQTELKICMVANSWFGMPRIGSSITAVNIRPGDSSIFEAIQNLDLCQVKWLLNNGEASIYDISAFNGHTLLGTLLFSSKHPTADDKSSEEIQSSIEKMALYLLREGCDPDVLSQTAQGSPSLMAYSLSNGFLNIPTILYDHGADPEWSPAYEHLYWLDQEILGRQMRLMHDWGLWHSALTNNLLACQKGLHFCCMNGDTEWMISVIEECGFDVNQDWLTETPLQVALRYENLELAAVMMAYGANIELSQAVEEDEPDNSALCYVLRFTTALSSVHLLLFNGAHPGYTWDDMFGWVFNNDQIVDMHRFVFDQLVSVAVHMLFHGANCHYLVEDREAPASIVGRSAKIPSYLKVKTQAEPVLDPAPQKRTMWTNAGIICTDEFDPTSELYINHRKNSSSVSGGTRSTLALDLLYDTEARTKGKHYGFDEDGYDSDSSCGSEYDREFPHHVFDEIQRKNAPRRFIKTEADGAFISKTDTSHGNAEFQRVISTKRGCRRLARYPVATAYYTAVQQAGYRAEMDDEGDIWWSDDDGDRYFDAREDQPLDWEDDGVVANCPMCRDPDEWGIGNIKRREKDGLEMMRKYKEEKKRQASWTKIYGSQ